MIERDLNPAGGIDCEASAGQLVHSRRQTPSGGSGVSRDNSSRTDVAALSASGQTTANQDTIGSTGRPAHTRTHTHS